MVHSDWSLPASQIAVISIRCELKPWVVFYKRYLSEIFCNFFVKVL